MTLDALLVEVEAWLRRHAPATAAQLAPPATDEDIARLEAAVGFRLLPEVVTLLQWHNGAGDQDGAFTLGPLHSMLSADAIAKTAHMLIKINDKSRLEMPDYHWWRRTWIPVTSDWCGAHHVVDHGPDTPGRVLYWDHETGEELLGPYHPSLTAFVAELLDALRHGTPIGDLRPIVTADGELDWD
ncbi:SMI1/KNR4 family protein [Dactylosporangium sp. CA-233914]|uniref:SMI1/KNR4 family protein n=1 Tax=Dactylosporangium sp. CA-233914 TaxID=3239934 RepID=UPI003D8E8928